ncbi:YajQ family cyclic di-GMP-binding protein [Geothrix sp. 21YS21S-4]|uniref:YajQ family cyclic di-GMP-binding protein n=1 Tax=Geothrix sp. 21YS21S-4 TaxID=3068889 RepID=UPI0027B94670|nr:YajQ family cyclic di-GMP-binding protein [Geothrix sp. 21YS21S-4]
MASECSFDVVCKVDLDEVKNAVSQAMKEIGQRYDFKGSVSKIELKDDKVLVLASDDEVKLKAVVDVLQTKLHKRGVSIRSMVYGKVEPAAKGSVRQEVTIEQGIPVEKAKGLIKAVKDAKIKVQASIQGDQLRVSGKNRDDLQEAIALFKKEDQGLDLQFTNYRG